jgi:hypothetical protein
MVRNVLLTDVDSDVDSLEIEQRVSSYKSMRRRGLSREVRIGVSRQKEGINETQLPSTTYLLYR